MGIIFSGATQNTVFTFSQLVMHKLNLFMVAVTSPITYLNRQEGFVFSLLRRLLQFLGCHIKALLSFLQGRYLSSARRSVNVQ